MQGRFVVAAVIIVLALAAGVHLSTTYDDYSRYNIQWNGTSSFFSLLEEHGAHEVERPADLGGYDDAVLLIIAPQGPPGAERIAAYRAFLARNNTVVLCDDFGSGNDLLAALGSGVTILPGNLTSVDRDYVDGAAVKGYRAGNHSLVDNVSSVLFNRPAALEGGTTLLQTSLLSWVDGNGNGRIDGGEAVGRYQVCVSEQVGGGELIVVGDPGIFLNAMSGFDDDNRLFLENILTLRPVLLIDQGWSRTASAGALTGGVRLVKEYPILQIAVAGLFIGAAAYFFRKRNH
ncbi:MAG: hypothetical protein PWP08_409 [Methanofollis sp.]|nr:hypothetical protein [Methanofollis sp.]